MGQPGETIEALRKFWNSHPDNKDNENVSDCLANSSLREITVRNDLNPGHFDEIEMNQGDSEGTLSMRNKSSGYLRSYWII